MAWPLLSRPHHRAHARPYTRTIEKASRTRLKERPMAPRTKAPKDAIALLTADHAAVRELLGELEKAAMKQGQEAETLLDTIEAALKIHTTIEEEIFYPAFREAASRKE